MLQQEEKNLLSLDMDNLMTALKSMPKNLPDVDGFMLLKVPSVKLKLPAGFADRNRVDPP